jgi:hypothetical protein
VGEGRVPVTRDQIGMGGEGASAQSRKCGRQTKGVMKALRRWSFNKFGVVMKELEVLKLKMDELLYREEIMWLQRSIVALLREGDRNTKFFHKKAAGRAKKNKIKHLRKEDGQYTKDRKEMCDMASTFFQQLYRADPLVCPQELLQLVQPMVMVNLNDDLCKEYSNQEIADALFQTGPIKVSLPNGFPAHFFQRN